MYVTAVGQKRGCRSSYTWPFSSAATLLGAENAASNISFTTYVKHIQTKLQFSSVFLKRNICVLHSKHLDWFDFKMHVELIKINNLKRWAKLQT